MSCGGDSAKASKSFFCVSKRCILLAQLRRFSVGKESVLRIFGVVNVTASRKVVPYVVPAVPIKSVFSRAVLVCACVYVPRSKQVPPSASAFVRRSAVIQKHTHTHNLRCCKQSLSSTSSSTARELVRGGYTSRRKSQEDVKKPRTGVGVCIVCVCELERAKTQIAKC